MEMPANFRQALHQREETIVEVPRVRTRKPDTLDAGYIVNRLEQAREVARGVVWRVVVIDDLSEKLHFLVSARIGIATAARMSAFGRIRSCPRVYGTTQKLQNSLQPSMIVTYAFTGSARRVIPSGNVTSSCGSRFSSAEGLGLRAF